MARCTHSRWATASRRFATLVSCFGWLAACAGGGEAPSGAEGAVTSTAAPGSGSTSAASAPAAASAMPRAGVMPTVGAGAGAPGTAPSRATAGSSGPAAQAGMPAAGSGTAAAAGVSGAQSAAAGSAGKSSSSVDLAGAGSATAGQGGQGAHAVAGAGGAKASALSPVYRIPLRVHVAQSQLSDAELGPILQEMNDIWLAQAGICFQVEVTESNDNRSDGFDVRYTSGRIPGATSANGLTQSAHAIWVIDHPQLSAAPHVVMSTTARTTAHELGHALGLEHQNPPPSNDCSSPCYCVERKDDCDNYLLRSGTKGYFLSPPEIEITRQHAAKLSLSDHGPTSCDAPVFMR